MKRAAPWIVFATAPVLGLPLAASAQQERALSPIEVTAPRITRDLYETPAAVSVVERESLQQGQQRVQLDEALSTVPGLFFQNRYNYAQNLRLSTRGFGARAPFGIRGIRVRVDGIPYTLPDGQSQIDAIDLDTAERVEIIRGPSSVQYGNASGGVIDITTATAPQAGSSGRVRADVGSDDFYKFNVQGGGRNEDTSANVSLTTLDYRGYREQSAVEKYLFNARVRHEYDSGRSITTTFNALDTPKAQDPAGLTRAQVEEDRQQATENARNLDSGQSVDQQTLGVIYEDPTTLEGILTLSTFYSRRDFTQQLPFFTPFSASEISYDRQFYGVSGQYEQTLDLAGRELTLATGLDIDRQEDDRRRYFVNSTGQRTGQGQDELQTGTSAGVFAQADLSVTPRLVASLGGRYDHLRLAIDDNFLSDESDDSGSRTFREYSGVAGLSYQLARRHQVYATVGTAFEAPTFTEFANPNGGGFNPNLEPQEAVNREIGMRGAFGNNVSYDIAVFSIRVSDEILPFDEGGTTYYENAGSTDRDGVELGVVWDMTAALQLTTALTVADYELDRFTDENGNDFSGNEFPGLPSAQWINELEWRGQGGRFAAVETQYTGDFYAENSNVTEVDDNWLVNLRAGDRIGFGEQSLGLYVGLRNVFDEDYFSNVRINANADDPVAERGYFEPAPGRTWYAGVEYAF